MESAKGKQGSREATAVIQARHGGGWARVEAEGAERSNEILKIEPTGFADGVDVVWERKRGIQVVSKVWDGAPGSIWKHLEAGATEGDGRAPGVAGSRVEVLRVKLAPVCCP